MKKSLPILVSLFMGISPVFANESISFKLNNDIKLDVINCPAGEFSLGSSKNEVGRQNSDLDIYNTSINKDFYIGKYEVTQEQYEAIMGENPSKNLEKDNPVERVTYYKAIEFCEKLNQITQRTRPQGYEFTLPTEVQWEYACRAGINSALNSGKELANAKGKSDELDELAWYKANSDTKTHKVGSKKPNNWGLYDMHGNVAEWCLDAYNGQEPASIVTNESKCTIRGGAYFYEPEKLRSASRGANAPNSLSSGFGFRVALVKTTEDKEDEKQQIAKVKTVNKTDNSQPEIKKEESQNKPEIQEKSSDTSKVSESTQTILASEQNEQAINNEQIEQPNQNTNNTDNTPITAGVKISVSVNGVKFPLMGCPKGEFIMNNKYKATINEGFYIGKYEVTQGQYKAIMGNNPSIITGDKLPVHNINWLDAKKFCEKLNELTKDKRPTGYVFSLPSEKQWEYACRSGYTTSLNNGKNLTNLSSSDNELNKLGWYEANSCEKIQTVGKKIANAWGIHDMLGNAWEFCGDNIPYEGNKYTNHRLVRGGGFNSKPQECTCSSRKIIKESSTDEELGFRIILKPID